MVQFFETDRQVATVVNVKVIEIGSNRKHVCDILPL